MQRYTFWKGHQDEDAGMDPYEHGEWVKTDEAIARITELEAALAAAREKNRELNRRCQKAESQIASNWYIIQQARSEGACAAYNRAMASRREDMDAAKKAGFVLGRQQERADRDAQWERAYREGYGKRRFGEPEWAIERRLSEGIAAIRERLAKEPKCDCGEPAMFGSLRCDECDEKEQDR